jgi:putative membrane protein
MPLHSSSSARPAWVGWLWLPVVVALLLSGWQPFDRTTWWMEVAPVGLAAPVLWVSRKRFPLTPLVSALIATHCLILIVGGAYSYARVPLGFWLQDLLGTARNPYDRVGHLAQGFVPALIAREILLRCGVTAGRWMLGFLCLCVALAISASYELIEWGAALALGQGADEFLGSQGDVWDTQNDMFCALMGALAALLLCSHWHDRQLAALLGTAAPVARPASVVRPTPPGG